MGFFKMKVKPCPVRRITINIMAVTQTQLAVYDKHASINRTLH